MTKNLTFSMIKPDAVKAGNVGNIVAMIEAKGFQILEMAMIEPGEENFRQFYAVHSERSFFEELVSFMSSGKVVVLALKKDNAVKDFRELIGATNPSEAKEGTIRQKYAKSIGENAIHGSDSDENAEIELDFFFDLDELKSA